VPLTGAAAPLALLALGLALYLPGLGSEVLRHPLEAKYALAAREMLEGGPLLVPYLYGELYPDKPPLYFWATAALGRLAGGQITEVTARLPAALAAVAGLLVTWALGRELFGARAGVLAAAVLGTSNLFFWYARQGHPDQFLCLFVSLACLAFWRGLAPDAPHRRAWTAGAYVAMALGVLSKGLIGLVLPLLAAAGYLVLTGGARALPARLALGPGLAVFLAIVLAWYAPAVTRHGIPYLHESLVRQHLVRFGDSWAHPAPWYFYLGEFPADFLPWLLFLPGTVVLGWRTRGEAPPRRPLLFPLAWFATGFLVFTLSSGKRSAYLLPLFPAAALAVGWGLDRALGTRDRSPWVGGPLAALCAVAVVVAAGLTLAPASLLRGPTMRLLQGTDARLLAAAALAVLAGATVVWLCWARGRPAAAVAALVAVQAGVLLGITSLRAAQYEARYPVRAFAGRVRAIVPPGEPVLSMLHDFDHIVAFYLRRSVRHHGAAEGGAAAWGDRAPAWAVVDGGDPDWVLVPGVRAVEETRLGPKRVTLVRVEDPRVLGASGARSAKAAGEAATLRP
jgi:4-amino-4-deoxy-L-arabinose transferase-like glycosyltransferase